MTTKLRSFLESHVQEFVDKNCDDVDWPDHYCYEELVEDMTKAAELVFDSCMKGQKYLETRTESTLL